MEKSLHWAPSRCGHVAFQGFRRCQNLSKLSRNRVFRRFAFRATQWEGLGQGATDGEGAADRRGVTNEAAGLRTKARNSAQPSLLCFSGTPSLLLSYLPFDTIARMTNETQTTLTLPEHVNMVSIVGPSDAVLHAVQEAFAARITVRGNTVSFSGDAAEVQSLAAVFGDLIKMAAAGNEPTVDDAKRSIELLRLSEYAPSALREDILLTYRGRTIRPKTAGQKHYVDAIRENTVTFGIGPAGTGKTYLAMAMAIAALKRKEVSRIILTRPVVEAGENLGFLPGSLTEKVDPYIRPLYDALFEMTDIERAKDLIDGGTIEIAPLAFMRGRTFNDSFIILNEAQNTTPEQMKMFLTRFGFGSHAVITGDASQKDLAPDRRSGLDVAMTVLRHVDGIRFITLDARDVVRHPLVQKIVKAYEDYELAAARRSRDHADHQDRADRADRQGRSGRFDRYDRQERADRSDRQERKPYGIQDRNRNPYRGSGRQKI